MHCLACDTMLSDMEANRKYSSWREIKNPEERYIGLCNDCINTTDLKVIASPNGEEVIFDEDGVE